MLSGNRPFPSKTRSWHALIARRSFWELPGAQFGVLGCSGLQGMLLGCLWVRWDSSKCLLGSSGPLLEGIWAPEGVPKQLETSFWGPCNRFSWFYQSFPMWGALHESSQLSARRSPAHCQINPEQYHHYSFVLHLSTFAYSPFLMSSSAFLYSSFLISLLTHFSICSTRILASTIQHDKAV